jgi:hypothetical protein
VKYTHTHTHTHTSYSRPNSLLLNFCEWRCLTDVLDGQTPRRGDGGCNVPRNVGILPQHYTVSQSTRSRAELAQKNENFKIGHCHSAECKYVSLNLRYGLDDRRSIPGRCSDGFFSFRHRVQSSSGAHPSSCSVGTGDSYPGVNLTGPEADH